MKRRLATYPITACVKFAVFFQTFFWQGDPTDNQSVGFFIIVILVA
jgi:hypothetical protein